MIMVLLVLLEVAYAGWQYKYNHYFTPGFHSEANFELQQGFSIGVSPLEQGPLLSTSYTYLGRMEFGVGLEQVIADRFSIRAQVIRGESGTGGKGELFVHFTPFNESNNAIQRKVHHGLVFSGSKVGDDWFVGAGYHFGFGNLNL